MTGAGRKHVREQFASVKRALMAGAAPVVPKLTEGPPESRSMSLSQDYTVVQTGQGTGLLFLSRRRSVISLP